MDTTPAAFDSIPRFRAVERGGHVFRVAAKVIGVNATHRWTGWADDAAQATARALADARQTWRGRSFAVVDVVQVGV